MLKDFTKEKFDIIVQAGQSNAQGCGRGHATNPYVPNENVWYLTPDMTIHVAAERVSSDQVNSDFSLAFARKYLENGHLKNGRKLLILRTAVGGTGFSDNRWGLEDDLFLRMMEMTKTALELNENNKLVAFLWHQGENDAGKQTPYETHYKNLSALYDTFTDTFNCKGLPFIAGDFARVWRNRWIENCIPVINAMINYCNRIKNGAFVTTEDLLANCESWECEDEIHFCRESLYTLGEKYFAEFEKMKKQNRKD